MAASPPSLFNRIIHGELSCHEAYEGRYVFAVLDTNPCSAGHTLVVPKEQRATLDRLSEESAAAVGRVVPRVSRVILAACDATDFKSLQNKGAAARQSVFHVHFHSIPKHRDGSGLRWPLVTTALDSEEGARIRDRLA